MSPNGFETEIDQGTTPALRLAEWLCASAPRHPDPLTHLKLQKLAFYCYGAVLAFGYETDCGEVPFEAWKHGPVAPQVYARYASFGREALPRPQKRSAYSARVEAVMGHVLNVYGRLNAWQLREESHDEAPWVVGYDESMRKPLMTQSLREHFTAKFRGPIVAFPERLFGGSSFLLDRVPVPTFSSLAEMSAAATRILGSVT